MTNRVYQIWTDGQPELVIAATMQAAVAVHKQWTFQENADEDINDEWYNDLLEQVVFIGELKEGPHISDNTCSVAGCSNDCVSDEDLCGNQRDGAEYGCGKQVCTDHQTWVSDPDCPQSVCPICIAKLYRDNELDKELDKVLNNDGAAK